MNISKINNSEGFFSISRWTFLITALVFALSGILIVLIVNYQMRQHALETAERKAKIILDRNYATHTYFSQQLKPAVFKLIEPILDSTYFEPAWMSSTYAVREIDKYFKNFNSAEYYYKECAVNARNPENEADEFEQDFLQTINADSKITNKTCVRVLNGKPYYVVLSKAETMEKSCIRCHGDPENAPLKLRDLYGDDRSFHRRIGEIVSAVSMRIPLASAYSSANRISMLLSLTLIGVLMFLYGILYFINQRFIFKPLSELQAKTDSIAVGDESIGTEVKLPRGKELRNLAGSFNRMSLRLRDQIDSLDETIQERTQNIKQINKNLKQEIEKHQRTNKALLESETLFRQIFDHVAVGIAQVSLDFKIEKANSAYCSMIGYLPEELIGKHLVEITHPENVEDNLLKQSQLGNGTIDHYRMEKTFVHKNGNKIYGILDANLIRNADGTPKYFLGTVLDITRRKNLENQLQQNQKMESIGTLAGGIAHDFNNILAAIIGFTELSLDEVKNNTHLEDNLQEIYAAGTRAKDLVKQILTISRHGDREIRPVRVTTLVKETIKMLRSTLPTSIEIQENIFTEKGVVNADATQLHQIIMNLATNAKQAMVDGNGVLEIGVDMVVFGSDIKHEYPDMQPGDYVRITVSDTGIGIQEKNIKNIFDPYFTTKEKGEGTGLGLSVVHGIVKSHKGHITVYSEPGKGTTFHVYLPAIIRSSSADHQEKAAMTLPTGTERVFVVDDESSIVKIQKQNLERLGYKVTVKTSSLEALETFKASPDKFDLIITDMTMPYMTGDKLSQEIKAIRPDIPVILCTGFSEKIIGLGENLNVDGFLMKPIDKAMMAKTIRKLLDDAGGVR